MKETKDELKTLYQTIESLEAQNQEYRKSILLLEGFVAVQDNVIKQTQEHLKLALEELKYINPKKSGSGAFF